MAFVVNGSCAACANASAAACTEATCARGYHTYDGAGGCAKELALAAYVGGGSSRTVGRGANFTLAALTSLDGGAAHLQVRKTPSWPRSWVNFSLLAVFPPKCMGQLASFGPT